MVVCEAAEVLALRYADEAERLAVELETSDSGRSSAPPSCGAWPRSAAP